MNTGSEPCAPGSGLLQPILPTPPRITGNCGAQTEHATRLRVRVRAQLLRLGDGRQRRARSRPKLPRTRPRVERLARSVCAPSTTRGKAQPLADGPDRWVCPARPRPPDSGRSSVGLKQTETPCGGRCSGSSRPTSDPSAPRTGRAASAAPAASDPAEPVAIDLLAGRRRQGRQAHQRQRAQSCKRRRCGFTRASGNCLARGSARWPVLPGKTSCL
jgi:hypothetical protein